MRKPINYIVAFIIPVLITSCTLKDSSEKKSDAGELNVLASKVFQQHVINGSIAGASVLIYKNGKTLLDQSYGYASLELEYPIPENAIFEIGSVTKQFTAVAILTLAEDSKLSLNDNLNQYIDFDTKGKTVTIGHLLNHTSGITNYTDLPEFWDMSLHTYPRDSMISLIERTSFLFEPGEHMSYNNTAYFLLGLIIESVSGKSYGEFLEERFFKPLGMYNTSYCSNTGIIKNKVYGYSETQNGLIQKAHIDHTWPYSAGSLCSTTNDLLTWMIALHNGKVLTEESYNLFITPKSLNDGTQLRYAMGIIHYDDFGNETIEHSGGINGFSAASRYYPRSDLYVVCLKNSTGPNNIAEKLVSELIWKLIDKKEPQSKELETNFQKYTGIYESQMSIQNSLLHLEIIEGSLILKYEENQVPDTINTYVGDNTWADGNHRITLKENEIIIDRLYFLERMKKLDQHQ